MREAQIRKAQAAMIFNNQQELNKGDVAQRKISKLQSRSTKYNYHHMQSIVTSRIIIHNYEGPIGCIMKKYQMRQTGLTADIN